MGKYQAYAEYRTVGNISEISIPASWMLSKVKYIGSYMNGFPFKPTQWDTEGVPIIRIQNLSNQNAEINLTEFVPPERYQVKRGDLLISWSATLDVYIWDREDAWLNQHIFLVSINKKLTEKGFFYWSAKWFMGELNEASHGSTMQHLTADKFGGFEVPLPPLQVQQEIANFLDHETAKIDTLIEKQQQLIQLLKEKRQAVISHAVTKGLNPDAPMKDSGVEWLGEVPEHWVVRRLKHSATLQSGIPKGKDNTGRVTIDVPMLRVANVQDGYLDLNDVHNISIEPHELQRYLLVNGDVLMNEGGDNDKLGRGAVWRAEIESCIHQNHVFAIRPIEVEPEWLDLVTRASYAKFHFFRVAKQSTNLASISSTNIKETPLVIPPTKERSEIISFVQDLMEAFEALEAKSFQQIELLKERHTALISAAVTGKIDVRRFNVDNQQMTT